VLSLLRWSGRARARIRRTLGDCQQATSSLPLTFCPSLFFLETFDSGQIPLHLVRRPGPTQLHHNLQDQRYSPFLLYLYSDPCSAFLQRPLLDHCLSKSSSNIIPSHAPCTASASARLRPRRRRPSRLVLSCPHCEPHVALLHGTTLSGIAPEIDGRVQRSIERYSPLFFAVRAYEKEIATIGIAY
jgi:hypothetical protein